MRILLSPSKTQTFELPEPEQFTLPQFLEDSQQLMDILTQQSRAQIGELMQISDALASLNYERFSRFSLPFSPQNARPAVFAFRGDVYDGLAADTLTAADIDFAQRHLRILSGLYGLLRPLDLIQAYRLEMKTPLDNPRGKNLYAFWGKRLAQQLVQETETVVNLASQEYFKALPTQVLSTVRVITPVFKERKGETYKVIAIYAKKARGQMARYLIRERISDTEGIKGFREGGYAFVEQFSTEDQWVFARD